MRTKIVRNIFISVGLLFALTGPLAADKPQPTIITFDAPGAVATFVAGINPAGVISGGYVDANNVLHGFVRAPDGIFTTYEAPGAGTDPGQGTGPNGGNTVGDITGNVTDASNLTHGYVRAKDGTITNFDAPGATVAFGTVGFGMNPAGAIAGIWGDPNMIHGFARAKDGTLTEFGLKGSSSTRTVHVTASCAPRTVLSPPSMPRASLPKPGSLAAPGTSIVVIAPTGARTKP